VTEVPFVTTIRARPEPLDLAAPDAPTISLRVQLASAWDAVRVDAEASESILTVKVRALQALDPGAGAPGDYYVTWRGVRILDEEESLASAGIVNGATLFIQHRRRRPVR
jgi:hypothetical protein